MRRLLAIGALIAGAILGGCTTVPATDMTGLAKAAYTAKVTYEGLLIVAVEYNKLPRCAASGAPVSAAPVCSDPNVIAQIRLAATAASATTQAAENAVRSLGATPSVVTAAVTAATQSVTALQAIATTYNLK